MNSHASSKKAGYAIRQQNSVTINASHAICSLFLASLILMLASLIALAFVVIASDSLLLASSLQLATSCLALASAASLAAWAFSTACTLDMLTSFLVSERRT